MEGPSVTRVAGKRAPRFRSVSTEAVMLFGPRACPRVSIDKPNLVSRINSSCNVTKDSVFQIEIYIFLKQIYILLDKDFQIIYSIDKLFQYNLKK